MNKEYDSIHCCPHWGYFPESLFKNGSPYKENEQPVRNGKYYDYSKESTWNMLSLIPIINIAIGILRLTDVQGVDPEVLHPDAYNALKTRQTLQILRGFSDIFLGPLNGIIDLVVTLARMHIASKTITA
jgi:hypothetical protein